MTTLTGKVGTPLYSLKSKQEEIMLQSTPYALGCFKDQFDSRDYQIKNILSTPYKGKDTIDYTNEMSPIKNQGDKGACVGFAVAAVLEWQQQKEYLKDKKEGSLYERGESHYDLSEQWVYHNAKEIDPWGENTEGTNIRSAMKIVNNKGVPKEKGWPYSTNSKGSPEFWAYSTANWNKNKEYYRINGLNELRKTLREVGPCAIGILVFREFYYPNSRGVVSYPDNPDKYYGGHAVAAIGDYPSDKLIKIKNSWGKSWGDNGYGFLPYNYIENFMMDAWVTVDAEIQKIY